MTVRSEVARERERQTWTQVRVELGLMREVDKVIERVHVFGARKYWSRSDFAKEAILKLLQEYETRPKNKKEETVIAAK
jgi:metal-responsive CopG/Arc/MetJ family transcriptional regulator